MGLKILYWGVVPNPTSFDVKGSESGWVFKNLSITKSPSASISLIAHLYIVCFILYAFFYGFEDCPENYQRVDI